MARKCEICGKKPLAGNTVSHANNKHRTRQLPNLKSVRAVVNGQSKRLRVCTTCIKSNRVVKPV